jgi:hypothetical protein
MCGRARFGDDKEKEVEMQKRLIWLALCGTIFAGVALYRPGSASATMAEGYKSTRVAVGRFGDIDTSGFLPRGLKAEANEQLWQSLQKTNGSSDLYVRSNVWQPGGSTGWHTHRGHSLIIVTAGNGDEL